jgi:Xaa-Pro aminopeptidase
VVKRLSLVAEELSRRGLDYLVVSNISNVRYLSGFSGSTAWLFASRNKATLITDFRYREQAEAEVYKGIEIKIDTREALNVVCEMVSEIKGKVGFEAGSLTYAAFETLRSSTKGLTPAEGLVEDLRKIKDENEIASISKAAAIADAVFAEILGEIRVGLSEVDVAARLDFLLRKKSSEVPAFKTIVASGPHASLPHATPTSRIIRKGDLVKMDYGAIWDGYCSDMTRTVVMGKASDKVKEVYGVVLEAQQRAIDGVSVGVACRDVDKIARDHIESKGYGENFGHGLGHGVGLEVHEGPRLSKKSEEILKAGNVVTVEPGIYIPGWGGVRIEDMVVARAGGCDVLTSADKRLMELGVEG